MAIRREPRHPICHVPHYPLSMSHVPRPKSQCSLFHGLQDLVPQCPMPLRVTIHVNSPPHSMLCVSYTHETRAPVENALCAMTQNSKSYAPCFVGSRISCHRMPCPFSAVPHAPGLIYPWIACPRGRCPMSHDSNLKVLYPLFHRRQGLVSPCSMRPCVAAHVHSPPYPMHRVPYAHGPRAPGVNAPYPTPGTSTSYASCFVDSRVSCHRMPCPFSAIPHAPGLIYLWVACPRRRCPMSHDSNLKVLCPLFHRRQGLVSLCPMPPRVIAHVHSPPYPMRRVSYAHGSCAREVNDPCPKP